MKIHPREQIVNNASHEIEMAVNAIRGRYRLTWGEVLQILSGILLRDSKYMIRYERHGNYDTPGGEDGE